MAYAIEHVDGTPVIVSAPNVVSGPLPHAGHELVFDTQQGPVRMIVVRIEHRIGRPCGGIEAHAVAIVRLA